MENANKSNLTSLIIILSGVEAIAPSCWVDPFGSR